MPKKEMEMNGKWAMHKKWMGTKMLILGILVLINAYWKIVGWDYFVGIVLAIAGFVKLLKY